MRAGSGGSGVASQHSILLKNPLAPRTAMGKRPTGDPLVANVVAACPPLAETLSTRCRNEQEAEQNGALLIDMIDKVSSGGGQAATRV